jgi:hypothetical protein
VTAAGAYLPQVRKRFPFPMTDGSLITTLCSACGLGMFRVKPFVNIVVSLTALFRPGTIGAFASKPDARDNMKRERYKLPNGISSRTG